MNFIDWTDDLSVGVETFDEQHKKLISIINKLFDALKQGKANNILSEIFDELIDYTKFHFKSEEQLMTKYGYKDYEYHLKEHNYLTDKVVDLKEKYKEGDLMISIEVMEFLRNWLKDHILVTDKKYGKFFNENGIN